MTKGIPDGYGGTVQLVMAKGMGEGSRGGHVTGHSSSGRAIYGGGGLLSDRQHPHYANGAPSGQFAIQHRDHNTFVGSMSADEHVKHGRIHMHARNDVHKDVDPSGKPGVLPSGQRKHLFDHHQYMHDAHMAAAHAMNTGKENFIDLAHKHVQAANKAHAKFNGTTMAKGMRLVMRAGLHEAMEKASALQVASAGRTKPVYRPGIAIRSTPGKRDARGTVISGDLTCQGYSAHYTRAERAPLGVLTIEGHEVGLPFHMVIGDWADAPEMMELALRTFAQGKFPDEGVFSTTDAPKPKWGVTQ